MDKKITELLKPIADTFKVAVEQLWEIFVRRYIVKGISELFTSMILCGGGYFIWNLDINNYKFFAILPIIIAILYIYDAINLLGNPKYWALDEIIDKIKGKK